MEIIFSNLKYDFFDKKINAVYGNKEDLINLGCEFQGINYDDDYIVKRFLNDSKYKDDSVIIDLFNELDIKESLLNKKIKDISKGELKLILLVYVLLNKKELLIFDYFDVCLSNKYKKKIINYIKTKYDGSVVFISNDLVFLNTLSKNVKIFKDNKVLFDGEFENLYKSNIKLDYPPIINFIRLANKKGAKLSYTVNELELLKDIYRSVR